MVNARGWNPTTSSFRQTSRTGGQYQQPTPPIINKWYHWGSNSICVCIVEFTYFTFKQKITMYLYTTLFYYSMFTTLNKNKNNSTRLLDRIKYPFPRHFFILSHTRLQFVTLTTNGGGLYSICRVNRMSALV